MDATVLSNGTVKLTVGTNTPTDAATLTLTRLPRYWFDKDTGASGEWYYYVKEVDAEGNEVHSASAPTNGERPEINLNVKTLTVTNTLTDPQGLDVAGQSVHAESREPPGHHADAQADRRGNGGGWRQDHRERYPWLGRGSGEGRREGSGWLAVWRSG